jgi:hypothetical protein
MRAYMRGKMVVINSGTTDGSLSRAQNAVGGTHAGHWSSRIIIIKQTRIFTKKLTFRIIYSAFEWWREHLHVMLQPNDS